MLKAALIFFPIPETGYRLERNYFAPPSCRLVQAYRPNFVKASNVHAVCSGKPETWYKEVFYELLPTRYRCWFSPDEFFLYFVGYLGLGYPNFGRNKITFNIMAGGHRARVQTIKVYLQ